MFACHRFKENGGTVIKQRLDTFDQVSSLQLQMLIEIYQFIVSNHCAQRNGFLPPLLDRKTVRHIDQLCWFWK